MADHDSDHQTSGGSPAESSRRSLAPAQPSLFTAHAAPGAVAGWPSQPLPVRAGRRPGLGSEILRRRQQIYPPPILPGFDLVEGGGYHREQVDEHLQELTNWARRETLRADGAEQTLRAVLDRLRDPAEFGAEGRRPAR